MVPLGVLKSKITTLELSGPHALELSQYLPLRGELATPTKQDSGTFYGFLSKFVMIPLITFICGPPPPPPPTTEESIMQILNRDVFILRP